MFVIYLKPIGSWTLVSSNIWLQLSKVLFPVFFHPSDLESLKAETALNFLRRDHTACSSLPRWQPDFRDLNPGSTSHSSKGLLQALSTPPGDLLLQLLGKFLPRSRGHVQADSSSETVDQDSPSLRKLCSFFFFTACLVSLLMPEKAMFLHPDASPGICQ